MLEKRFCRTVTVSEMQFSFMPERGTIDAVLQEQHMMVGMKMEVVWKKGGLKWEKQVEKEHMKVGL